MTAEKLRRCFICREPTGEEEGAAIHLLTWPDGRLGDVCETCFQRGEEELESQRAEDPEC